MLEKNRRDMAHDTKFAENVYLIISSFMDKIDSVDGLEKYYLANKKAILTMKANDNTCYDRLIDDFKKKKADILTTTQDK